MTMKVRNDEHTEPLIACFICITIREKAVGIETLQFAKLQQVCCPVYVDRMQNSRRCIPLQRQKVDLDKYLCLGIAV